jgi:hypothetical protein
VIKIYETDYTVADVTEQVTEMVITEILEQGPAGPPGDALANIIDDAAPQPDKAYSGQKTEARLTEENTNMDNKLGNTDADLVVHFRNALSQGV